MRDLDECTSFDVGYAPEITQLQLGLLLSITKGS